MKTLHHQQKRMPGKTVEEVLDKLSGEIQLNMQQVTDAGGSKLRPSVDILQHKESLQSCKGFVLANNTNTTQRQPAFAAFLSKVKAAFCSCSTLQDAPPFGSSSKCEFHDKGHTLQDVIWGFARLMEQEDVVPDAVPAVGSAAVQLALKASGESRGSSCDNPKAAQIPEATNK